MSRMNYDGEKLVGGSDGGDNRGSRCRGVVEPVTMHTNMLCLASSARL